MGIPYLCVSKHVPNIDILPRQYVRLNLTKYTVKKIKNKPKNQNTENQQHNQLKKKAVFIFLLFFNIDIAKSNLN